MEFELVHHAVTSSFGVYCCFGRCWLVERSVRDWVRLTASAAGETEN